MQHKGQVGRYIYVVTKEEILEDFGHSYREKSWACQSLADAKRLVSKLTSACKSSDWMYEYFIERVQLIQDSAEHSPAGPIRIWRYSWRGDRYFWKRGGFRVKGQESQKVRFKKGELVRFLSRKEHFAAFSVLGRNGVIQRKCRGEDCYNVIIMNDKGSISNVYVAGFQLQAFEGTLDDSELILQEVSDYLRSSIGMDEETFLTLYRDQPFCENVDRYDFETKSIVPRYRKS